MDLILRNPAIFPSGRSGPAVGGQKMADVKTVAEILGTGTVTTLITYFFTRGDKLRESDRSRLQHLETRMDIKDKEMDELRSDKLKLEAQVFTLEHQIADLNVLITKYQQNEIAFHATIAELQTRLTAKTTELRTAQERLKTIKEAADRGEVLKSVLFQGQKHVDVVDVVEVELDTD